MTNKKPFNYDGQRKEQRQVELLRLERIRREGDSKINEPVSVRWYSGSFTMFKRDRGEKARFFMVSFKVAQDPRLVSTTIKRAFQDIGMSSGGTHGK